MKIRTDFVTNSSSSSYVCMSIKTTDDKNSYILEGEDIYYTGGQILSVKKGKLYYRTDNGKNKQVETVAELMGVLASPLFDGEMCNDEFVLLFRYLLKEIDDEEFVSKVYANEYFEYIKEDYETEEEFLDDIDNIIETLLDDCYIDSSLFNEDDEDCDEECEDDDDFYDDDNPLKGFVKFAKEWSLDDIKSIEIDVTDFERDEGMNQYIEALAYIMDEKGLELVEMSEDDPKFEEEVEKWTQIMEKEVFRGKEVDFFDGGIEDYVRNALISGDTFDLLPSSASVSDGYTIKIKK